MLIFEWETTRFEVVVEHHKQAAAFKVERLPNEILIDLGKFSCAATLHARKVRPNRAPRLTYAAVLLAATFGFTLGITDTAAEAKDWVKQTHLYQKFHPE